jgi:predicted ester cyclase
LFANSLRERSTKETSTRQGSSSGKTSSSKFRFPGQGPGLAGLKDILRAMRAAFPDLHWSVEEQIVEGDKVVTRFEWTGRHCAESRHPGDRPRGESLGLVTDRLVTGRIKDTRILMDTLGLMMQLGVISPPANA